ncbi:hypothetical protein BSKO_10919 [Bryopsis sp. KO-2023]|nr:hypothetical protein BSKO_10919 [Bryopsis sp. KO-2023]
MVFKLTVVHGTRFMLSGSCLGARTTTQDATHRVSSIPASPPPSPAEIPIAQNEKPGELDATRFELHPSVEFWKNFNFYGVLDSDSGLDRYARAITTASNAVIEKGIASNPEMARYWGYHALRSAFFMGNGLASIALNYFSNRNDANVATSSKSFLDGVTGGGALYRILNAFAMYDQDLRNIQQGLYKKPWDMTSLTHRQSNPLYVAYKSAQFLQDANRILTRRNKTGKEPVWLKSDMYPSYYLDTRHFQTDGWLSRKSAQVYEFSTETLFIGRQDAMQRQTLVPIARHMKEKNSSEMKMMDMACGTGRFLTFVKDNYPGMDVTALDLSPYYLSEARSNLEYWFNHTQKKTPAGKSSMKATYIQAPAENVPCETNSLDLITCIYLFHEIPTAVRGEIAAEMFRLLKPGGMAVLADSIQYGDRPRQDPFLNYFEKFDEPWVVDYYQHDLGALFESVGFKCDLKVVGCSTKVLSFKKPE